MSFAFGGTGTGGGAGLEIEVVQALPVYQEDIRIYPVFYFRRSDNTYHQAFSDPLAADEAASMTRNVLAQANITGNATWRGTVDNLNDIVTPAADDWAFEHRAGHNRLWWYDGTTWYGSDHPGRPSIETAFGANYIFLRPDGTFATDTALRNAFNNRDIDYDASKQYLFLDVADDNVHRVTAFSPFIPAGTKKNFVNVGAAMFDAATITAIADAEIDSGVKDYAKTGGGDVPDGDIPAGITRDNEVKPYALVSGRRIMPADADDAFMLDSEFTAAAVRTLIGLTAAQLNDLVTGGSISGRTVTLNQADGTTITFMVPPDTNTQDGVLASGSIDAAGTTLTLTLDTGTDVTVDIPAALRMGGGGGITLADVKEFARAGERGVRVGDIDSESAADNTVITADGSGAADWEAQQGGTPTPGDHTRRAAISTDTTLEQAEYNDSTTSMTQEITIPTWTMGSRYVFLGVPEAEDDITDIDQNGISEFSDWQRVTGVLFEHKWWRKTDIVNVFGSGRTYNITQ